MGGVKVFLVDITKSSTKLVSSALVLDNLVDEKGYGDDFCG